MAHEQLKLNNQVCFRLYTASRLTTQAYEPFLNKLGITYTQYLVLMVLWEEDNQPINDIGKKLMLGINTISPLIKRMESMGLLQRRTGENDKRQQIVCLTEQSRQMEAEAARIPGCMVEAASEKGFNAESFLKLIPLLDDYIQKMTQS